MSFGTEFLPKLPNILQAAVSEETQEDVQHLLETVTTALQDVGVEAGEIVQEVQGLVDVFVKSAGTCSEIVLDIVREPLQAAGVDPGHARTAPDKLKRRLVQHVDAANDGYAEMLSSLHSGKV